MPNSKALKLKEKRLLPVGLNVLDSPDVIRAVADWMVQKENHQWLHFGDGVGVLTPEWLRILTQRPDVFLRVYTAGEGGEPIGVVGLDDVNRSFRTARIWIVAGDKSFPARGYATRAASKMLTYAFGELDIHSIYTWIVEGNPSVRIAKRLNFRFIGRQRRCHSIDGGRRDRLWFDVLATEHREIE